MGEYACPKCGRLFKTLQQRKGHLLKHVSEEELVNLVLKNTEENEVEGMIEAEVIE